MCRWVNYLWIFASISQTMESLNNMYVKYPPTTPGGSHIAAFYVALSAQLTASYKSKDANKFKSEYV